jgi:uncharacterized protein YjiS (DUF1127 family)
MRQPTFSFVETAWARHARHANGFGDAAVLEAPPGSRSGHAAGNGEVRPRGWLHAVASAMRALADALRARAAERRRRRLARETFVVLNGLDGRTLRDLGFHRSEIASVANEVAGLAETTRAHPERFNEGR